MNEGQNTNAYLLSFKDSVSETVDSLLNGKEFPSLWEAGTLF